MSGLCPHSPLTHATAVCVIELDNKDVGGLDAGLESYPHPMLASGFRDAR
jgi:hypothetical protein